MPNLSANDNDATRDQASQPKSADAPNPHGPSTSLPSVATAAFIGSIVAIILSPLSFYLSQFLSRPVLSIEYVETVSAEPVITVSASAIGALVQSPGYMTFISEHPAERATIYPGLRGSLSVEQAKQLVRSLGTLEKDLREKLARIKAIEKDLTRETNPANVKLMIQNYTGPLFNSFAVVNDPLTSMKASFLQQLQADAGPASDLLEKTESILKSVRDPTSPAANVQFKVSVLNRGDTDGLIRSVGRFELLDAKLSTEISRIEQPKPVNSTASALAVPVAVTNPPDAIREQSVGRVEKHSMIEAWFAINEKKLSASQSTSLTGLLPHIQSSRFRITLTDQENSEIEYSSPSR